MYSFCFYGPCQLGAPNLQRPQQPILQDSWNFGVMLSPHRRLRADICAHSARQLLVDLQEPPHEWLVTSVGDIEFVVQERSFHFFPQEAIVSFSRRWCSIPRISLLGRCRTLPSPQESQGWLGEKCHVGHRTKTEMYHLPLHSSLDGPRILRMESPRSLETDSSHDMFLVLWEGLLLQTQRDTEQRLQPSDIMVTWSFKSADLQSFASVPGRMNGRFSTFFY